MFKTIGVCVFVILLIISFWTLTLTIFEHMPYRITETTAGPVPANTLIGEFKSGVKLTYLTVCINGIKYVTPEFEQGIAPLLNENGNVIICKGE